MEAGRSDVSKLDAFPAEDLKRVLQDRADISIEVRKERVAMALTLLKDRGASPDLAMQVSHVQQTRLAEIAYNCFL